MLGYSFAMVLGDSDSSSAIPEYASPVCDSSSMVSLKNQKLELSLSLLKNNIEKTEDNFIVSPFSFYIMADLLANGAKGETLQKLQEKILDKKGEYSLEDINRAVECEMKELSSAAEINNSIWGNNVNVGYKKIIAPLSVDIFKLPSNTNKINKWIKKKTHGMVTNMFASGSTSVTDLFLVNTVYFKDKWYKPFDKENTEIKNFYSLYDLNPTIVNMMYLSDDAIAYYENDKFQAIRLLYEKGDYIDIILPREEVDFKKFVQDLEINDLDVRYEYKNVNVSIPKFETEYKFSLNDFMKQLNVPIFNDDENVDFSVMCSQCSVKKIAQQATIRLDEEGTVAAAVTEGDCVFGIENDWETPKNFNANRPFVYIINDGLFVGVYMQGKMFE